MVGTDQSQERSQSMISPAGNMRACEYLVFPGGQDVAVQSAES